MKGATAKLHLKKRYGNPEFRVVVIRNNKNNKIYRLIFRSPKLITAESSLNFRKTAYSFRNLSETDTKKIKPNRIQVIPVKSGDTVEILSNIMNINRFKEETFRVLNGLAPSEKLREGRLVKIIVD
jgi:predicted Zn-dependent protease